MRPILRRKTPADPIKQSDSGEFNPREKAFRLWVEREFPGCTGFMVSTSNHVHTLGLHRRDKLRLDTTIYPQIGDIVVFQCYHRPRWKLVGLFVGDAILRPERAVSLAEVSDIVGVAVEPRGLQSPTRVA